MPPASPPPERLIGPPTKKSRTRRRWAAAESLAVGYGGEAVVSSATGLARETIRKGRREIARDEAPTDRIRRPGGGRPRIQQDQPGIQAALEALVDPLTRGDPTSPLRWTCKSRAKLAGALVDRIGNVRTATGLRVLAELDAGQYPTGVTVTKEQMDALALVPDAFHGEWNYPDEVDNFIVESRGRRVAGREPVAYPVLSQPGRRPTPVGTFPPPALRTRRADFQHRALQWNHAARTRVPGRDQRTGLRESWHWARTRALAGRCVVGPVDAPTTATAQVVPFAYACDDIWHSC